MQVKIAIKHSVMALAAVTALHAPLAQGKEMTSYAYRAPVSSVEAVPVVSSSVKVIAPARIKVMQNEQKILDHSPYAKAASVDLSQVGMNTVPVVTPTLVLALAPAVASVTDAAGASTDAAKNDIVQTGAGY